jgi:hypothetical protein
VSTASPSAPVASALVGPSPVAVAVVDVVDPDLELRLPPGWVALTAEELRAQIELARANAPEGFADLDDELLREIADGELRAGASGSSGSEPWQATLLVEVTPADSVEAQIDRNARAQPPSIKPKATLRTVVATPLGDGVRVMVTADPPAGAIGAVAARSITFYVDLGDGRILWINATAPEASTTFEALMDQLIAGVRRG